MARKRPGARRGTPREVAKSIEILVARLAEKVSVEPEKAVHIFKLISSPENKKGLSDEELEDLTGYKQGEIRKILRLFYESRLAYYRRGKHPETEATRYYWLTDPELINSTLLRRKKAVVGKLKARLEYESGQEFYVCPADGSRFTFSEAFDLDFACPKCGLPLEQEDNSAYMRVLRERIEELEEEISRDERTIYTG